MDATIIMKRTLQDGNRLDKHRIVEAFSPSRSAARLFVQFRECRPEPAFTSWKLLLGS